MVAEGQGGEDTSALTGKNEKTTAAHNVCRSGYYYRRRRLCLFPTKRKQNWPTLKLSVLYISKTLYGSENKAVSMS